MVGVTRSTFCFSTTRTKWFGEMTVRSRRTTTLEGACPCFFSYHTHFVLCVASTHVIFELESVTYVLYSSILSVFILSFFFFFLSFYLSIFLSRLTPRTYVRTYLFALFSNPTFFGHARWQWGCSSDRVLRWCHCCSQRHWARADPTRCGAVC